MSQLVSGAKSGAGALWRRRLAVAAMATLLLAACLAQFFLPLNHDVAWYLYAAKWHGEGCRIYVDCFFDPNPPFVLWFSRIALALGRLPGLTDKDGSLLACFVVIAVSFHFGRRALRGGFGLAPWAEPLVLFAMLFNVTLFQLLQFGQRDYLAALLVLPYVLLVARREAAAPMAWPDAAAIGVLASLALCFKPHTVLVLAAAELCVVSTTIRAPRARAPELIGLAAGLTTAFTVLMLFGGAYFGFVKQIAYYYPYLNLMPDQIRSAYLFQAPKLAVMLLAATALLRTETPARPMLKLCLVAGLGAVASYALQGKGFPYHRAPMDLFTGATAVWLAVVWVQRRRSRPAIPEARAPSSIAALGVLALLLFGAQAGVATVVMTRTALMSSDASLSRARLAAADPSTLEDMLRRFHVAEDVVALRLALRTAGPEQTMLLSTSLVPLFPAIVDADIKYASRFQCLWFVPRLVYDAQVGVPGAGPASLGIDFLAILAEDIGRTRPKILIVQEGPQIGVPAEGFSLIRFLKMSNAAVAAAMDQYECLECGGRTERFDIYRRKAGAP